MVKGIYDLILETVLTKGKTILISSNTYPTELVKSKLTTNMRMQSRCGRR